MMGFPLTYTRGESLFEQTLPLQRYYKKHEQTDEYYWTGRTSNKYASYLVSGKDKSEQLPSFMKLTDQEYKHFNHSVEIYRKKLTLEARWRRLLSVVMMTSSFEQYFKDVCHLALRSDPTRVLGFPKKLDGIFLIKNEINLDIPNLNNLVVGSWPSRIAFFEQLFGAVPESLEVNKGKPEEIRLLRNRISHQFGQDIDKDMLVDTLDIVRESRDKSTKYKLSYAEISNHEISDNKVLKYLAVFDEVVQGVDKFLLDEFIGGFEIVEFYLKWVKNPEEVEDRYDDGVVRNWSDGSKGDFVRFKKLFNRVFVVNSPSNYIESMVRFVDNI